MPLSSLPQSFCLRQKASSLPEGAFYMLPEEKAKAFFHLIRQLKLTPSPQGEGSFYELIFGQLRHLSENPLSSQHRWQCYLALSLFAFGKNPVPSQRELQSLCFRTRKITAFFTAVLSGKKSPCGAFIPDAQQIM